MRPKAIVLLSGGEEGYSWSLKVGISEGTKNFTGHFTVASEERRRRNRIRHKDRKFFQKRLGSLMDTYEVNHDWENGERVTLLTPKEHRNTPFGKSNQTNWIEEEEWLQEKWKN